MTLVQYNGKYPIIIVDAGDQRTVTPGEKLDITDPERFITVRGIRIFDDV